MPVRWDEMDTVQLFRELRESENPKLREYLIEKHEGLVRHVARDYADSGEDYDDIYSVGRIGLIAAVDRYDPEFGTKFATFAVPTIKGEIRRYFRDVTWSMRVPRRMQELSAEARKVQRRLTKQLQRSPTYAEVARELGVPEEQVIEAVEVGRQYDAVSIDAGESDDERQSHLQRTGQPDENIRHLLDREEVADLLERLPKRQELILIMRYYLDMSQESVGERLGISQMHVSRLQHRALDRLKSLIEHS
jgi:RNA polymerase sigma-B factor